LRSLLDLSLSPPPPSSFTSPLPPLDTKLVPALSPSTRACVIDRRRQREFSTRKTSMCRAWQETGRCNYGIKCKFAHGESELRRVERDNGNGEKSSIRFRTMPCLKFKILGTCPYADRCTYQHGPSVDIETLIAEELAEEIEDRRASIKCSWMTSLYSSTSSISSLPSIDNPSIFDPFFTPTEAKTINFEIRPF
ncbi:hypothetical protein PENTCL1PPCAC_6849, partial [Pristionchus entomophagus]